MKYNKEKTVFDKKDKSSINRPGTDKQQEPDLNKKPGDAWKQGDKR